MSGFTEEGSEAQKVRNTFCNTIVATTPSTYSEVLSSVDFIPTLFTALHTSPLHASGTFFCDVARQVFHSVSIAFAAYADRSLSSHCTKRWKRYFLMCNGLFHLAERQKPQLALHEKMETLLSDMKWLVPPGGTTEASARTARKDGNATF